MFSRKTTITSTKNYPEQIDKLKNETESADAVVIGAGARLSTSAGFDKKDCFIHRGIMVYSNVLSLVVKKPLKIRKW